MKKTILYLSVILLFFSCKKSHTDPIQFPSETQIGANTFGCYIDGIAFIPSTTLFGLVHPINVYYTYDSTQYYKAGFLSIQGIDARYTADSIAGSIVIQKLKVFGTGEYILSHNDNCTGSYDCDDGAYENSVQGITYFIETGKLIITKLDTVNKIISGRFDFIATDTSGFKKEITNGVFDTKYMN